MRRILETWKDKSDALTSAFGNWVVNWKWAVLGGTLFIALLAASGARYAGFNNDYHIFFSEENPQMQAYDALQNKYTKDDNVLIAIRPKEGGIFTKDNLAALEELTQAAWKTPFSTRVDGINNFQHTRSVDDDLFVDDLSYETSTKSDEDIEDIKKIALKEPFLKDRLVNKDGSVAAVNIAIQLPGKAIGEELEVLAFVRNLQKDFEAQHPNLETYLSGMVPLTGAFAEASAGDMGTLMPLMFLIIIAVILLTTRSISGTVSSLVVLFMSVATAVGLSGYLGIKFSAPSAAAPTMIMTLAIADSIHILATMLQFMRKGYAKREAIVESLRVNFMPVFITSLTTVIGFLTMNFSDSPPFHDLGNIAAMGIAAAYLYSIMTLPALMAILPVKVKVVQEREAKPSFLTGLSNFVVSKHKAIFWGTSIAVLLFSVLITQNTMSDEFAKYFDDRFEFRTDTDFISDNLTGIYTVEFSLGAGEPGGINNPEYLKKLEEFERWFEKQKHVVHVNSFSEVSRRVNKSMHGDDPNYYQIPDSREEAAQYLLLYEMSLPLGLDLNNTVNVDKSETRFVVTLEQISSNEMIATTERAENWLKTNAPEYMFANGISTTIMFAHLTQRQAKSMISGGIMAILLISLILIFALRSLRHGLLSLIPNLAPIAIGFGLWAIVDGVVNSGLMVVFGMTLGIIVDDTVHFLSKYLRAKRELGMSAADSVQYAFQTVGRAMIITTVVLSAGFLVLTQSGFAMNSGMAKITLITIIAALVVDFLLLPALLLLIGDKDQATELQPVTVRNDNGNRYAGTLD